MTARRTALLLIAVVVLLGGYMLVRSVELFETGQAKGVLLGVGVVLLVLLGALLVAGEVRFGFATERLGQRLGEEGGLPADDVDVPRTASGRLTVEAAEQVFAVRRAETEADPDDWRAWFRLGIAYSDARDTPRARKAMRTAVRLERGSGQ